MKNIYPQTVGRSLTAVSIAVLLVVSLSTSCTKDHSEGLITNIVIQSEVNLGETFEIQMSQEEAASHVNDWLNQVDVQTRGLGSSRRISNIHRVKDEKMTRAGLTGTDHYVLNFADEQGFAIVLGDNRLADPVIAITESGHLDPEEGTDSPGLATALALAENYYERELISFTDTVGILNRLTPIYASFNEVEIPYPSFLFPKIKRILGGKGHASQPWIYRYFGRRTNLNWHQYAPFNNNVKPIDGKQPPLGCTATATMLLMAWHQYPKAYQGHTYNWTEMLKHNNTLTNGGRPNKAAESDLAKLSQVTTWYEHLHMSFGLDGSGADELYIIRTLKSLGYSEGGTHTNWNEKIAKKQLEMPPHYPVVVSGFSIETEYTFLGIPVYSAYSKGHTFLLEAASKGSRRVDWSADAVKLICQYLTDKEQVNRYLDDLAKGKKFYSIHSRELVYVNYGWTGTEDDGYYFWGIFDANSDPLETRSGTEGNYQFDIDMVYGAHP